jgi:hypothetical protein
MAAITHSADIHDTPQIVAMTCVKVGASGNPGAKLDLRFGSAVAIYTCYGMSGTWPTEKNRSSG